MVVQEKKTYRAVSEELKSMFPNVAGQSIQGAGTYYDSHNIHATSQLIDAELDTLVINNVHDVNNTGNLPYSKVLYMYPKSLLALQQILNALRPGLGHQRDMYIGA